MKKVKYTILRVLRHSYRYYGDSCFNTQAELKFVICHGSVESSLMLIVYF